MEQQDLNIKNVLVSKRIVDDVVTTDQNKKRKHASSWIKNIVSDVTPRSNQTENVEAIIAALEDEILVLQSKKKKYEEIVEVLRAREHFREAVNLFEKDEQTYFLSHIESIIKAAAKYYANNMDKTELDKIVKDLLHSRPTFKCNKNDANAKDDAL